MHIKRHSLSDMWASPVSSERYRHVLQEYITLRGALTVLPVRGNVGRSKTEKPKGSSPCINYTVAFENFGRPMNGTKDLQTLPNTMRNVLC